MNTMKKPYPPFGMPCAEGSGELPEVVFGPMPMMMGGPGGPGGPGDPEGPGGPGGPPPKREKPTLAAAVRISDGQTHEDPDQIQGGKITSTSAEALKVHSDAPLLGGVYVKGGSEYTIDGADIYLKGNSNDDFSGVGAAVMADEGATVTLKNAKIVTDGVVRTATVATNGSKMYVYNSHLETHGGILPADYTPRIGPGMLEPPAPLGIGGTCRTNLTMENSESYFYDSTILANGWGALSTDSAKDRVYLEANRCNVIVKDTGYCAYADGNCHDVFNDCTFATPDMAAIIAGKSDVTYTNTAADCGGNFAMMHCVMGMLTEVSELHVNGGRVTAGDDVVLVKSANSYIAFRGTEITAKNGVLIHSVINSDPMATHPNGEDVYGINVALRDVQVSGDILHEDHERTMAVTLENTLFTGAIQNTYLKIGHGSKWTASGASDVVLVDMDSLDGIDACAGITINAAAGANCTLHGVHTLPSGGTIIIE